MANLNAYVQEAVNNADVLAELTTYAADYAHSIGLVGLWSERSECNDLSTTPPIALLPSPFPRELYDKAMRVQRAMNELYFRVSQDHDFLVEVYRDVVKADKWIARQMTMMETVWLAGPVGKPKFVLQLQRTDYLTHLPNNGDEIELKQVEVNIGQIGGFGMAQNTTKLHQRMMEKLDALHADDDGTDSDAMMTMAMDANNNNNGEKKRKNGKTSLKTLLNSHSATIPANPCGDGIAQALFEAWKLFGDEHAVIVYCYKQTTYPLFHHEQLQFVQFEVEKLAKRNGQSGGVNVLRMCWEECAQKMELDKKRDLFVVDNGGRRKRRVALVHLASGYAEEDYESERHWECRLKMELSTATISPDIRLQLACTKKVQQVLAKPGIIERFLLSDTNNNGMELKEEEKNEHIKMVKEIRSTIIGLWGLGNGDEEGMESVAVNSVLNDAIKCPGNYVLKAQTGCGKGNYFDAQLAEMLQKMTAQERGAFILQQKICPLLCKNIMKRPFCEPTLETVISELGIFGTLIGTLDQRGEKTNCGGNAKLYRNSVEGYFVRTKKHMENQGGIISGAGVSDSLLLLPSATLCNTLL